jgi:hypothetical protein
MRSLPGTASRYINMNKRLVRIETLAELAEKHRLPPKE